MAAVGRGGASNLTGSQRGAPEYIDIAEVDSVAALRLKSAERNQAWYDEHPAVVDHAVYGHPDAETQDDFFLYATGWTTEENPYLLAQVYIGNFESGMSLRMKVRYENASHNEVGGFPGISYDGSGVILRGPGRPDIIKIPPNHQGPGWVTLGMTVTESGDIIYVGKSGTHSLAELFSRPDFKYRNSGNFQKWFPLSCCIQFRTGSGSRDVLPEDVPRRTKRDCVYRIRQESSRRGHHRQQCPVTGAGAGSRGAGVGCRENPGTCR